MINIPKTADDPFYRYKRPLTKLSTQKTGKKFDNLDEIAKSIYSTSDTVMKFIQKNLGCRVNKDIILSKNVSPVDIENILEKLIEQNLCKRCRNPEVVFKKSNKTCKACGYTEKIEKSSK